MATRRTISKRTKPGPPKKPTARTAVRCSGRTVVRLPFGVEVESEGAQGLVLLAGTGFVMYTTAKVLREIVADDVGTRRTTHSTPAPLPLLPAPSRR